MSDRIKIKFDQDMPSASVEVVAPDLQTVQRLWMDSGQLSSEIEVPSEDSFLRVHLASGQSLVVRQPGEDVRNVSMQGLSQNQAMQRNVKGDLFVAESHAPPVVKPTIPLDSGVQLKLTDNDFAIPGEGSGQYASYRDFSHPSSADALDLIAWDTEWELSVRLPKRLRSVFVYMEFNKRSAPSLIVEVATESPQADALSSYLNRGDYYSAEGMTSWAHKAETMFQQKQLDPSAAAVGAYLLLRLRRFDLMRDWARNLADWWPELADGAIIWAWQQIHQRGDEQEIKSYLLRAADAELPVFSQGLKMLTDGLHLLSGESIGKPKLGSLSEESGVVQWDSPFTATVRFSGTPSHLPRFVIRYDTSAGEVSNQEND